MEAVRIALLLVAAALACAAMRVQGPELAAGVALACLIAFSRLYLYVHYPSDILVGAVVGAAVGVLSVRLVLWLWPEKTPS